MISALLLMLAASRTQSPQPDVICDILRRPDRYEGKQVVVDAMRAPDIEMLLLAGPRCPAGGTLVVTRASEPKAGDALRWYLRAAEMRHGERPVIAIATYIGVIHVVRGGPGPRRTVLFDIISANHYRLVVSSPATNLKMR